MNRAVGQSKVSISYEEIKQIVDSIDSSGHHKLDYREFISATIDIKKFLNENRLKAIFSIFDTDSNGTITAKNLKLAF